jgi:regulator of protease activity HflC (stomatin/prohibitin superfamily)
MQGTRIGKFALVFFFLIIAAISSASCTTVEPGYVGIKVNQYGSQRGVQDFPLLTGRVFYNPITEDVHKFPTFLQNIVWTKDPQEGSPNDDSITFNSIEGAIINADIALSYGFVAEKVPSIFVEFRRDPDVITRTYMRSQVRDSFSRIGSQMKVTDIFGARKQEFLEAVKKDLSERMAPKGFYFDMISFVGALRVDQRVASSINAVIEATQRAQEAENKVKQTEAEARQRIAQAEGEAQAILRVAEAQAKANEVVSKSLTAELVRYQAMQKWNGVMPQVTGNGAIPFFPVPSTNGK